MADSKGIDQRLKNITPTMQWGCQPLSQSICLIEDNEFVACAGGRMIVLDDDVSHHGSKIMFPPHSEAISITSLILSEDRKYLASCIRCLSTKNRATVLVYDVESHRSFPKRPKILYHEVTESSYSEYHFTGGVFSLDSVLLACYSNQPSCGIIIFDWLRDKITHKIPTKATLTHVSFNEKK